MRVTTCDRCEQKTGVHPGDSGAGPGMAEVEIRERPSPGVGVKIRQIDLCEDCLRLLRDWIVAKPC